MIIFAQPGKPRIASIGGRFHGVHRFHDGLGPDATIGAGGAVPPRLQVGLLWAEGGDGGGHRPVIRSRSRPAASAVTRRSSETSTWSIGVPRAPAMLGQVPASARPAPSIMQPAHGQEVPEGGGPGRGVQIADQQHRMGGAGDSAPSSPSCQLRWVTDSALWGARVWTTKRSTACPL